MGIGVSRLFYQIINVVVIILFGHYFMKFTLINGVVTFLEMLLFSLYMLFLLMGAGLIISSIAKNDTMIPLMINIFALPQMLLAGTFFHWMCFLYGCRNYVKCFLLPSLIMHFAKFPSKAYTSMSAGKKLVTWVYGRL